MQMIHMFDSESFRILDESLQLPLLWIDGVFLMGRDTEKLRVELFSLYGFYVEAFFDEADEFLLVKPFEETGGLHHYLKMLMWMTWLKTGINSMKRSSYRQRDPFSMILIVILVLFVISILLIITRSI